jgi:hypothetical protein
MRLRFTVESLPPKKDGATSMWRKNSELERLKALRLTAVQAIAGQDACTSRVELEIIVFADRHHGDLDTFVAGICDGLMAAHPLATELDASWSDLPAEAHPKRAIAYEDDALVERIEAERRPMIGTAPRYDVEIRGA